MKSQNPAQLKIRHLNKIYSNGVYALRDISLDVRKGEFLAIIGRSGSGKSTLLRCINRLIDPSSGEMELNGRPIAEVKGADVRKLRTEVAMIFQHFNLIPRTTVLRNVLSGRLARTSTFRSILNLYTDQDYNDAHKYLELVGIGNKAHIRVDQLSGGQQQRVAIARALMQNPQILLADEPVASLDPATCHVVMDYLRSINQELGVTVVANLHFLSLVREYATRVIALVDGKVAFEGLPDQIDSSLFKQIYGEDAKEVHTV